MILSGVQRLRPPQDCSFHPSPHGHGHPSCCRSMVGTSALHQLLQQLQRNSTGHVGPFCVIATHVARCRHVPICAISRHLPTRAMRICTIPLQAIFAFICGWACLCIIHSDPMCCGVPGVEMYVLATHLCSPMQAGCGYGYRIHCSSGLGLVQPIVCRLLLGELTFPVACAYRAAATATGCHQAKVNCFACSCPHQQQMSTQPPALQLLHSHCYSHDLLWRKRISGRWLHGQISLC